MTAVQNEDDSHILLTTCPDQHGLVATVSQFLTVNGGGIYSLEQSVDPFTQTFFMRAVFRLDRNKETIENLKVKFESVANELNMTWGMYAPKIPTKTIIMVSKYDHCLDDLLYRKRNGELNIDVVAVVSNHSDLRPMVEREGICFIHLPVDSQNKAQQEERLLEIIEEKKANLVILARYMQILSDKLSAQLSGKCINIHHSFLPGFKGAKPYHQAYERGVKVIGATAHYVTSDLDEGPIIEQILTRVDHNYGPQQLVRVGRDNECQALAKAVKYHIERRVFICGNKTVIFLGG
jgi:formyltetrahydrofolate deformylase